MSTPGFDALSFHWDTAPANSQTVVVIDTTRIPDNSGATGSIATNSVLLAPGKCRAQFAGGVLSFIVKNGDKDGTVKMEVLTDNGNASTDWEEDSDAPSNGSATVTASTTTPFEWKPSGRDYRLRYVAGADNPDELDISGTMFGPGYDFGS